MISNDLETGEETILGENANAQTSTPWFLDEVVISRCERTQETISVIWSNVNLNQTQDIQVTTFYEVVQERAFIANGSTIDKSKIGRARV